MCRVFWPKCLLCALSKTKNLQCLVIQGCRAFTMDELLSFLTMRSSGCETVVSLPFRKDEADLCFLGSVLLFVAL